jgi:hypothetical protein
MSDSDSEKTSSLSLFIDDNDNRLIYSEIENKMLDTKADWIDIDSEIEDLKVDEKFLGDGSDEDDSLLVIYQESSSVY